MTTPGTGSAIETLGLRKAYLSVRGRTVGVDGLDLRVPAGGVHALLGLEGSGRTTTLRLLTGLARADGGAVKIFGVTVPDGLPELAGRIGAVVGEPGFQAGLSGRGNLALLAGAAGVPRSRVDELLARVVLTERAKASYGTYSVDEARRLELAAALLRDPDLLVVDEPSRGLGAVGTREIRQALRLLADQGKTVLVATGVLAEAQQIADTVTVLDGGRVLAQGAVPDLLGDAAVTVRVRLDDPVKAATALRAAGFTVRSDGEVLHVDGVTEPADISRALAKQKLFAGELVPQREDLAAVVGRLRPVALPTPDPVSRAEARAERRAAERRDAEQRKAAEKKLAEKEKAVERKAAEQKRAAEQEVAARKAAERKKSGRPAAAGDGGASPKPSRIAQRRAAFDAKVAQKQAAARERLARRQAAAEAKAAARQARADEKVAAEQARVDESTAGKRPGTGEKAAGKQAGTGEKAAGKQAGTGEKAAGKQAGTDGKAAGKQAESDVPAVPTPQPGTVDGQSAARRQGTERAKGRR